ncbi:MAG TPA: aldehyde dehydrogenase (NADP(+)) [Fimbriimonadaceae bacterium]|jgi:NADP-dependent aldehyde dehydrogenase
MINTPLTGSNFIGGARSSLGEESFHAIRAEDGSTLETAFSIATSEEIERAVVVASQAFPEYAACDSSQRAGFLEQIALNIEGLGERLVERACEETALPTARVTGERARTCGQLRLLAELIREGSWVDARIDTADPNRASGPKPDIRRMLVPIGPVAVFGASNFPLAFSVAGGDTASALAAGCPVVVKAHPSHPGTSELVARAIIAAAESTNMPKGVFSMLHGGKEVGQELVVQPGLEAVGFTGSHAAGRALFDLANARPKPIPVFAEMGSVNPLFVLPGALQQKAEQIAKGYATSLTLGVGQFCTNPGVLVCVKSEATDAFLRAVSSHLAESVPGCMLNEGILRNFHAGADRLSAHGLVTDLTKTEQPNGRAQAALFTTSARHFIENRSLQEEVFGPAAIAVVCDGFDQLEEVAKSLKGQLTASLFFEESDAVAAQQILPILTRLAGRVLANGFPTGVEVCSAMQHGGPYPATTDSRFTSVGTAAILRFVRPIAYQNVPDEFLPAELQDANPKGIWRMINGRFSNAKTG